MSRFGELLAAPGQVQPRGFEAYTVSRCDTYLQIRDTGTKEIVAHILVR